MACGKKSRLLPKIASWSFQVLKESVFTTTTQQVGCCKLLSKPLMENFLQLASTRQPEYMLTKVKEKNSYGIFVRKIATYFLLKIIYPAKT